MPPPAKPKSYLLTSATTPLGHALATHLLSTGANVAACTSTPHTPLTTLLTIPTGTLLAPHLDPSIPSTTQSALATATASFGRLDAVIHVGIPTLIGALEELSPAQIALQLESGYYQRARTVL